jgi:hypothetical protein
MRDAASKKQATCNEIQQLESLGALTSDEAKAEKERAEDTFRTARQAAYAARDERYRQDAQSTQDVRPDSRAASTMEADDGVVIVGESQEPPAPMSQRTLTGNSISQAPAFLREDPKAKHGDLVKKGLQRSREQTQACTPLRDFMQSFVRRGRTPQELGTATRSAIQQRQAASLRSVRPWFASPYNTRDASPRPTTFRT